MKIQVAEKWRTGCSKHKQEQENVWQILGIVSNWYLLSNLKLLKLQLQNSITLPPDAKSWLIGKDPDAGKDWGQEEKGETEGKMVGWHHWLSWHEFEQIPGDSEEQGNLACCRPWDCKELDTAEWLHNNSAILVSFI